MVEQQRSPETPSQRPATSTLAEKGSEAKRRPTLLKQLWRGIVLGLLIFVLSLLVTIFL